MNNHIQHDGDLKIDWAAERMPVLRAIAADIAQSGALNGKRVGVCLVLEPKTANLALALRDSGAVVSVYCQASSTRDDVADALRGRGVQVFASESATEEEDLALADEFLDGDLEILVDDGASLIRRLHSHHPDQVSALIGAAEETTSGVRPLRAMEADGALGVSVLAVNDARSKYLFDNLYGTGQSCIMTFLDVTNLQLAGKTCLVIGYGWVGRGVARHAAAMGARIVVSEIDPINALQATYDGHEVSSIDAAGPRVDVVFSATGVRNSLTVEHLDSLKDGVFLAVAGGTFDEIPMTYLHSLDAREHVRPDVDLYSLSNGRSVLVIADGDCMNVTAGEGNPIEVMDLSLSLQALAVEQIALGNVSSTPGVHLLPKEVEERVARIRLEADGSQLEPLTDTIRAALKAW